MLVVAQRMRGTEYHDEGEEIPLDLEPTVRAIVECIAYNRIAGADQAAEKHHVF